MCKILRSNRVTLYFSAFAKILQKDVNKDKKRDKDDKKYNTNHDKSSEAMKLIPRPKTTKISTRMQKCKKLNRICLEENLENLLASLERSFQ